MPTDRNERRSPLGLGPLETAIMRVMWETGTWLTVRDIRSQMDYARAGHTTVAKVAGILYEKGLLIRRLGNREGKPGPMAWWYHAARPASEHIGALIAALLDLSPNPEASLNYALGHAAYPNPGEVSHQWEMALAL